MTGAHAGGVKSLRETAVVLAIVGLPSFCCRTGGGCRVYLIKLNKVLWKSDFDAYAVRGVPITGRAYQRLPLGPAPREMKPVYREMMQQGLIMQEKVDFGDGVKELRTIPLVEPDMSLFTLDDIKFVDQAIFYYWLMTGTETSDDSHDAAWMTRHNGDPMPYQAAVLSDRRPGPKQMARAHRMMEERGWTTDYVGRAAYPLFGSLR